MKLIKEFFGKLAAYVAAAVGVLLLCASVLASVLLPVAILVGLIALVVHLV